MTISPFFFGQKGIRKLATSQDNSPLLKSPTYTQQVVGSLLYYARAIESTILLSLNGISSQQSKSTEKTLQKCKILLDYVYTYKNTFLRYQASNRVLHVESDTAYLMVPGDKSTVAGFLLIQRSSG